MEFDTFVGFESDTESTVIHQRVTSLGIFASSAAFEAASGVSTEGNYYINTSDGLLKYYIGSEWTTLGDHLADANIGTNTHTEIDTHLDSTSEEHFLMLDENDFASDSDTKCPSQQSLKAYVDTEASSYTSDVSFLYNSTITTGDLIRIINDSGAKVDKLTSTAFDSDDYRAETPVTFESAATSKISCCFDSNSNKVVIIYKDEGNSNYGTAVVGTIANKIISFGTPVVFSGTTAIVQQLCCCFDTNSNKVVIIYEHRGIVGTVSGTGISFGTAVSFDSGAYSASCCFAPNYNQVVVVYEGPYTGPGTAIVGTVSSTSISFKPTIIFESGQIKYTSCCYDSNSEKVVASYQDVGDFYYGKAIVLTLGDAAESSISKGTIATFASARTEYISSCFDSNSNKVVIAYQDYANTYKGTSIVGTVSSTTISFGTEVVFENAVTSDITCCFDSEYNKVIIAYKDEGNSNYGTAIVGIVASTSISYDTAVVYETGQSDNNFCCFDSSSARVAIAYTDNGNSDYGKVAAFGPLEYFPADEIDFFGIAQESGTSGQTKKVALPYQVSDIHTSLTPNTNYYVQTDMTLGTTVTSYPVGRSISSTEIYINKE